MTGRRGVVAALLIALGGVVVFVGVGVRADRYLSEQHSKKYTTTACRTPQANHVVLIQDDAFVPAQTSAKICDSLTFKNNGDKLRLIGFGQHDNHQAYDGITQKSLGPGENFTITLNEYGMYSFHDHFQDELVGTFTVAN